MSNKITAFSIPAPIFNFPAPILAPVDLNSPRKIQLGHGGGGVVVISQDPLTESPVAKKTINYMGLAEAELNSLNDLAPNTPHMIGIRRAYEVLDPSTPGEPKVCIEMDLIREKNIYKAYLCRGCPRLEIEEIKSIGCQLFEFLAVSEKERYIHGDLKPENLIWERLRHALTVIDFGAAHKIGSSHTNRSGTTFPYAPPELILEKERTSSFDLWSAGCILFELITGNLFCLFKDGLNKTQSYQYALQQIVSQIGPPSFNYFMECEATDLCFDNQMKLRTTWDIPNRPFWRDAVTQSLVAQKVSKVEINQWIDLLSKLLSYEDRGRAKVHLESPLFKSEARVHLVYDIACKCKVFIHRAGFLSLDTVPRIQDIPLMDVSIDLKVHKDHRCVHIPLDPNDKYFVFMDNGRTQMVAPFSLKGTDRLNIAQMQRVLDESSNGELESPTKKWKPEKIPEEEPVQDEEFRIASRIPAFRAPTF